MLKQVALDGGTDEVAVELPLEIRLNGAPVAVTMRTPGDDFELAAGFLYGEGIVSAAPEMTLPEDLAANIVDAVAPDAVAPATRRFYTTSSCGICGKGALEEVEAIAPVVTGGPTIPRALLAELPDRLSQPTFERTGGLHATGLFSADGELLEVREDVGRHNAMDKVVGWALGEGRLPLSGSLLCVSGRLSFELVQKAAVAGCPILVAVGGPSSLAVELADDRGVTLCGFVRGGRGTVYAHAGRIVP